MRKWMITAGCLVIMTLPSTMVAQNNDQSQIKHVKQEAKKGAKKAKEGIKRGADEVAQQASEIKADAVDHEVEDKAGPGGEDVFRDDRGRYYYVNQQGKNVYLKKSELRNKSKSK